jgi:hypothetical protein
LQNVDIKENLTTEINAGSWGQQGDRLVYYFFFSNIPLILFCIAVYIVVFRVLLFDFVTCVFLFPCRAAVVKALRYSRKVSGSIPGGVTGDHFRGTRQFQVPGADSAS